MIENLKDLIVYQSQNNENISIEVLYDNEDFWLTQKLMGKLFGVEVNTINYHLKEVFKSGELIEESVIRKIRITANDGKNYNTNFYSLDAISLIAESNNVIAQAFYESLGYMREVGYIMHKNEKEWSDTE